MSAKIIDSRRYKTITKSQLEKKRKNNENRIKKEKKVSLKKQAKSFSPLNTTSDNSSIISNIKLKMHTKKKKEQEILLYARPKKEKVINTEKKRIYIPKQAIIAICIVAGIVLSILSIKITKIDKKISETVFNNVSETTSDNVPLQTNYSLKVALSNLDTTNAYLTNNLILSDAFRNINHVSKKYRKDYRHGI